jgi:rare lipoprotein A
MAVLLIAPSALSAETSSRGEVQLEARPAQTGEPLAGEEGLAAYYSGRYKGRRTNSGHRYDPRKLTAAHPSLAFGTRVKIINLANDKEVVVTVNDRCRPQKQPFIDLSREAARRLGFLGKGTARVQIIPLEEETADN